MIDNSSIPLSLAFEMMSDEDIHHFQFSIFMFSQHDVIDIEYAKLLYDMELLQLSPVKEFKSGDKTVQHCCVRFTTKGRQSVKDLRRIVGLTAKEFESLPDPFEREVADADFTLKFLMHDRRLRKELAASPERVKAVIARYAVGFEEELDPRGGGKAQHFLQSTF